MYVAITRAKERLYLTRSKSRYLYGHRDITSPSRFIAELASELGIPEKRNTYGSFGERYGGDGYGGYRNYGALRGSALYSDDSGYQSDEPPKSSVSFKAAWNVKKPAENKNNGKYTVGMKVRHPKFGLGMVVAVKNNGGTVNVAFDGQGIKELSASLAPLEIVK